MKRKNSGPVVDLRAFMERSAAKKRQTENQMQLVAWRASTSLYKEQRGSIKMPLITTSSMLICFWVSLMGNFVILITFFMR